MEMLVNNHRVISRRRALQSMACGFGSLALADLAHSQANPLAARAGHHAAKAKRVIFIFMQGGPSHVDSFDYKPRLIEDDGKMLHFDDARSLAKTGKGVTQRVMKPRWAFRQHGESGQWISELLPHIAKRADDLCVIK